MYDHKKIEKKWQRFWEDNKTFRFTNTKKKFYSLVMFPYPSGYGLHIGHPRSYTAVDIIARKRRSEGYDVLAPMGWDAFGLPAENYAIKSGVHPIETTKKSINNFRHQLKSLGLSYDWLREINTSSRSYYKWTQWLFIKLFEAGLAYQKEAPVNWCSSCKTVLANEQTIDGNCERCGSRVEQKLLKQWFFKITDYAEELLSDLDNLDWPEKIKLMQKNWIGKSVGAKIFFKTTKSDQTIQVFTTRPDTLYGVTYLVLSPENTFIAENQSSIENYKDVLKYLNQASNKTELERKTNKQKSGIELKGIKAIHPLTEDILPIWVSDYVLAEYGTGAIMAVPAHDERDWEFAKTFNLPIVEVIQSADNQLLPNVNEGTLINSDKWNNWHTPRSINKIIKWLEENKIGKGETRYKLRDWLVSRQRYWGAPIPIIYCQKCGISTVPLDELPVLLPIDVDFNPTGESPLARSKSFNKPVKCKKCNNLAQREIDTMDTFVDSSWYYLRYIDPKNNSEAFNSKLIKKVMPVDLYVGGAEHAVLHLLYARFIMKALSNILSLNIQEPFIKLKNQGLILAFDGKKMSKSLGNVVNPDDVIKKYGADTLRTYQMFMGPFEDAIPWSDTSIIGVRRFLEKIILCSDKVVDDYQDSVDAQNIVEETIDKVSKDIEEFKFNTAVSALMIAINQLMTVEKISKKLYSRFLQVLNPFAPHLSAELWSKIGMESSIDFTAWPKAKIIQSKTIDFIVQINGKTKHIIQINHGLPENEIINTLKTDEQFRQIFDNQIKKTIFVVNKIINFII